MKARAGSLCCTFGGRATSIKVDACKTLPALGDLEGPTLKVLDKSNRISRDIWYDKLQTVDDSRCFASSILVSSQEVAFGLSASTSEIREQPAMALDLINGCWRNCACNGMSAAISCSPQLHTEFDPFVWSRTDERTIEGKRQTWFR